MLKLECGKTVPLCLHEAVAVGCGNLVWILWGFCGGGDVTVTAAPS